MKKSIAMTLVAFGFYLTACQTGPSKVYETRNLNVDLLKQGAREELRINESTVIVDARRVFDYHLAHVSGSVNLQWTEFSEHRSEVPGQLKQDKYAMTRRLARLGISPNKKVIVVGYGQQGQGEAGRLAWTFLVLGLPNVQMADFYYFRDQVTNTKSPPLEVQPIWKPRINEEIIADRTEFLKAVTAAEDIGEDVHIIDVRTKKEYFSKKQMGGEYETPNLRALHIDWREFITKQGRPNLSLADKLEEVGVKPDDRVYLISNQGVRSATATIALLSMGYAGAANFAGGYAALLQK